ncbi:hypothetical protein [Thiosocius teredinicola]|uniref:hypothetical protein n=1 Tax=Thiosocius teredinicola TaxID=1973002 RepID=UPI000F7676C8
MKIDHTILLRAFLIFVIALLLPIAAIGEEKLVCKGHRGGLAAEFENAQFTETDSEPYSSEDQRFMIFSENGGKSELYDIACEIDPPVHQLTNVQHVQESDGQLRVAARSSSTNRLFVFQSKNMSAFSVGVFLSKSAKSPEGLVLLTTYTCEYRSIDRLSALCEKSP